PTGSSSPATPLTAQSSGNGRSRTGSTTSGRSRAGRRNWHAGSSPSTDGSTARSSSNRRCTCSMRRVARRSEESASTEEILVDGGVIFALVNKGESELTNYLPAHNTGDQARVAREWKWNEQPREIHAYDAESGELIWSQESVVAPLTMALDGQRIVYHDGHKIVARDRTTGESVWETGPAGRRDTVEINFGP